MLTLDDARSLATLGRHREAIASATDCNRRNPDPRLEYQLVQWRWAAFVASDGPAPVIRRSDIPDLFPDLTPPPEVPGSELSAPAIGSAIAHHGCLVVRGMVARADAERLCAGVDHVFDAWNACRSGAPLEQTLPWYAPLRLPTDNARLTKHRQYVQRAGAAINTADSPRMLFQLIEVLEGAGVLGIIQEYLGERPVLSVQKATLRLVPPTTGAEWHQDGAFLGPDVRAANVWVALSECGIDAPGLDLLPKRIPYIVETGTEGAKAGWTVGPGKVAEVAAGTPIASPVFMPGDAVVFDHLFLHRTGVRPGMTKARRAIESWFFAPSAKPREHDALFI